MGEYCKFRVLGENGLRGTMFATSRFLDESPQRLLRLEDGREFLIPASAFQAREDGSYFLRLAPGELSRYSALGPPAGGTLPDAQPPGQTVIPVVEEELEVDKRRVETGRVRIHKRVSETESVVDEPLSKDEYEVARVPVNRIIEAPVEVRQEGDTTIIPVFEEVLVVEKRLILREEVRITRKRQEIHDPKRVSLRKENVEIERIEGPRS